MSLDILMEALVGTNSIIASRSIFISRDRAILMKANECRRDISFWR
jgi:hypothetical protein